jgi:glucose-1-phosphate adenylyltransferase
MARVKGVVGVILGGGKGTRLFPLTLIRSKPAVPLGGKYRLVDIPISNCINSGINRIFVLTQYNSESLNRHITQTYRFGLFSEGFVDILAAEQTPDSVTWYQGTADAVRQSLRHILTYRPKYILILSGDHLYRMDYRQLLRHHKEKNADITLCVYPVTRENAHQLGILRMDNTGRIVEFVEKPQDPEVIERLKVDVRVLASLGVSEDRCLLASMGIYLFNTESLVKVLSEEPKMDFGRDIIPAAIPRYKVYGYVFDSYWEDIGTIEAFYRANLDLTAENPKFSFYAPEAPIYSHPRFLPASRILNCRLTRSIVSEGCEIHSSSIEDSVIGIRSMIREGTEIRRTLVLGADFYDDEPIDPIPLGIGPACRIQGAIIDKNARIGAGVKILNERGLRDHDGENYYVRDGIVIIPKNAKIPDGTVI